jgi:hypothetical protein
MGTDLSIDAQEAANTDNDPMMSCLFIGDFLPLFFRLSEEIEIYLAFL